MHNLQGHLPMPCPRFFASIPCGWCFTSLHTRLGGLINLCVRNDVTCRPRQILSTAIQGLILCLFEGAMSSTHTNLPPVWGCPRRPCWRVLVCAFQPVHAYNKFLIVDGLDPTGLTRLHRELQRPRPLKCSDCVGVGCNISLNRAGYCSCRR